MVLSRSRRPDLDETLGVHRVDPENKQRHIFDFRSKVQNVNGPEVENMKFHNFRVSVETLSINPKVSSASK